MARNYKKFPITIVNNYIADYLEEQEVSDKIIQLPDGPQPTIVPGGQTPELIDAVIDGSDRAPAFITYDYELDQHVKSGIGIDCERIGYTIYAPTASKILEVVAVFKDLFGSDDISARLVNQYSREKGYTGFHYLDFRCEIAGGPVATRSDGGRYAAAVNIHYNFTYSLDKDGLRNSSIFSK